MGSSTLRNQRRTLGPLAGPVSCKGSLRSCATPYGVLHLQHTTLQTINKYSGLEPDDGPGLAQHPFICCPYQLAPLTGT